MPEVSRPQLFRRGSSVRTWLNSESGLPPDPTFPKRLKRAENRFWRKRRTEEHRLLIASFRRYRDFRQCTFQGFALGIEGLLCRWWNRDVSSLGKNRAE